MNLRDRSPNKSSASEWALPGHRNRAGRDSNADGQTESGCLCILFPSTLTPSSTSSHHTVPSPSFSLILPLSPFIPLSFLDSPINPHVSILSHHPPSSPHPFLLGPLSASSSSHSGFCQRCLRMSSAETGTTAAHRVSSCLTSKPTSTPDTIFLPQLHQCFFSSIKWLEISTYVSLWHWSHIDRDIGMCGEMTQVWLTGFGGHRSWMCGVGLMSRGSESVTPAWLVARQGRMTASGNSVSHNQTYR